MIQLLPRLTDDRGSLTPWGEEIIEPLPGSIVLTNGMHGTAYQRLFSDGLWHSAHSRIGFTWKDMLGERNLLLAYDAPARETGAQR